MPLQLSCVREKHVTCNLAPDGELFAVHLWMEEDFTVSGHAKVSPDNAGEV